jgi:uncharacterized SAM-binding protein YcdF (DUF218 family)
MIYRLAVGITVVVTGVIAVFFIWGHDFLCTEPGLPAQRVDVAVVLAGPPDEDRERVLVAVDLVQAEEAGLLMLPVRHRALGWPWFVRKYRIRTPVPEDRVIIGREENSKSESWPDPGGTFAEARKAIEIMRRLNLHSAVVVSSGYHMRRARLAFERANPDPGVVFYFHPVDVLDPEDSGPWWMNGGYALRVADEYIKLAGGYLFYR